MIRNSTDHLTRFGLFLLVCLAILPLSATANSIVPDSDLDLMRGGFQVPQGLHFSFGIERTIAINGELQSMETLHITDADVAALFRGDAAASQLLQAFNPVYVIQNNLNGQVISALTVVDVSVVGSDQLRQHGVRSFVGEQIMLLAR